jgi:hypothetical protein
MILHENYQKIKPQFDASPEQPACQPQTEPSPMAEVVAFVLGYHRQKLADAAAQSEIERA